MTAWESSLERELTRKHNASYIAGWNDAIAAVETSFRQAGRIQFTRPQAADFALRFSRAALQPEDKHE